MAKFGTSSASSKSEQLENLRKTLGTSHNADSYEVMGRYLSGLLAAGGKRPDIRRDEQLERYRAQCRDGNPFPLIAYQWPFLKVTDDRERSIFRSNMERAQDADITDCMKDAIFAKDTKTLRLDWWQYIILAAFFDVTVGEIFIKGCTGSGKGASTAIGINCWFDAYPDSRTHLTSRDYTHALTNIFGEVSKWNRQMVSPQGSLLKESLSDSERHYAKIINPSQSDPTAGEKFSGLHGPHTLSVFDEASAVPDNFFENVEKNSRKIVALSNPRVLSGRFRNAFKGLVDENKIGMLYGNIGNRVCVTAGGMDCINVSQGRLKKPVAPRDGFSVAGQDFKQGERIPDSMWDIVKSLIPEQIDVQQFRDNMAKPDSRLVDVFAHGRFPAEDATLQVMLMSWLERHINAWTPDLPVECFGLDVARSLDGDKTVLAAGGSKGMRALHDWKYNDVDFHASEVLRIARDEYGIDLLKGKHPLCIDYGGGYGAGVGDPLRKRGVWVIEFQPGSRAQVMPQLYNNLRTEGYALLGRKLNPDDQWRGETWALPPCNENLYMDLTAPQKVYGRDFLRFGIEPKEEIKKRLSGRSPDYGDATTYLFHAVKELHDWNKFFESFERDLITYPEPAPPTEDGKPAEPERDIFDVADYEAREFGIQPPDADKPVVESSMSRRLRGLFGDDE